MECVYEGHPAENGGSAYTGGCVNYPENDRFIPRLIPFDMLNLEPLLLGWQISNSRAWSPFYRLSLSFSKLWIRSSCTSKSLMF